MRNLIPIGVALLLTGAFALAEETDETDDQQTQSPSQAADGAGQTRAMSGMSILGNEEAPKSLVIVPWKSSEIGDDISLSDTLDDRAKPIDKEVFLRELSFYEIRSSE